jgi:hypothetical protein
MARIAPSRRGVSLGRCFAADAACGLVAGGAGGGKACSFRWLSAQGRDVAASAAAEDEEHAELELSKAAAKERAAAKKKQRVVTKGGGFKAKKGGTARTG